MAASPAAIQAVVVTAVVATEITTVSKEMSTLHRRFQRKIAMPLFRWEIGIDRNVPRRHRIVQRNSLE